MALRSPSKALKFNHTFIHIFSLYTTFVAFKQNEVGETYLVFFSEQEL